MPSLCQDSCICSSMNRRIRTRLSHIDWLFRQIPYIIKANDINCMLDTPAKENRVNIYDYQPMRYGYQMYQDSPFNLGDALGKVIVRFLLEKKGIDVDQWIPHKKHLFTVGSNIFGSSIKGNYQDATIWGSGILKEPLRHEAIAQRLSRRKLDIRAVRGPLSREVLLRFGHKCPEVYGDPAILMPLFYQPKSEKKYKYNIVSQFVHEQEFHETHPNERMISMNTDNYKYVIDEIVSSELIFSSSLHGIILAESYGVPAIFFRGLGKRIDFKYLDYYYSTGRTDIRISESFEEALNREPLPIPDLSELRQGLLDSFPYDLWDSTV